MKNTKDYSAAVLTLLAEKDFSILSSSEKYLVLAEMDEETYKRLHLTYKNVQMAEQNADYNLTLRAATHTNLLAALDAKNKPGKTNILMYQIPAWQAAAAMLVLFFCSYLYFGFSKSKPAAMAIQTITDTVEIINTQVEQVFLKDTIYVEKLVTKFVATNETPLITSKNEPQQVTAFTSPQEKLSVIELSTINQLRETGQSMADDSLVGKFGFVGVN